MSISKLQGAMEAPGTDGDRGPWIYSFLGLGSTGYSPFSIGSSSSSGTIVSTAYTSSGSGSGMSSVPIHIYMEDTYGNYAKLTKIQKMQQIKNLVQEFFGAPSANCSIIEGGGDMSVLQRWFSDLGVRWVLQLDDGVASAATYDCDFYAPSWVSGLFEIMDTICLVVSGGKYYASIVDALQFAQFIQKAMLKMLAFVDVIVAWNAEMTIPVTSGLPPSCDKLSSLVSVHGALSKCLLEIPYLVEVKWIPFFDVKKKAVEKIMLEIGSLLSAKERYIRAAVSTTIQSISSQVRRFLYVDDSMSSQGSSDIHKATRSVMRYISILRSNYSSMAPFLSKAVAGSLGIKTVQPLDSMTVQMTSCLEEKLVKVSKSFPDQGLRFLFLLNNLYFIQESILFFTLLKIKKPGNKECRQRYSSLDIHVAALFEKLDRYMESYVQESWEPVLSCLFNPSTTPICLLTRSNSVLPKFESAFQKTYATQKLWKVPDPKLRKSLRAAIIEKIIPDYTKYIEENNIATPEFTPKAMEEMLQELFEG